MNVRTPGRMNPERPHVGHTIAALEGTEDGLAVGSGAAAVSLTLLSLARSGDHIVGSSYLCGAARLFLEEELPLRGTRVTFVNPENARGWRHAMRPETRALYLEIPTNPTLRVFDFRPVARLAHERGVPLIVDATSATPVNLCPVEHGADIVVHSAMTLLGGRSDLTGGIVCGPEALISEVRRLAELYGTAIDPRSAELLDEGVRTLPVRIARHTESATALADWFAVHDEVERVVHPSRPEHPDHALARELLRGGGGMLGIVLKGGAAAAARFVNALGVVTPRPNPGDIETVVSLPRLTSHRRTSLAVREEMGIPEGFVRISVGVEGIKELKEGFRKGLTAASTS